jgi:ribosomal protein S18
MKYIFAFISLLFISLLTTNGKTTNRQHSPDSIPGAKKIAIAVTGVDTENDLKEKILNYLKEVSIDDRYIPVRLSETKIPAPGLQKFNTENISTRQKKQLTKWLNSNKAGQAILSQWFNRQPDGSFNTDYLQKTGILNESALKIIDSNQPVSDEMARQLAGSPLNETYLLVFDFRNLQTMEEYYNRNETASENRILDGFIASIDTWIFRLDFNQWVAKKFLNDFYASTGDEAAMEKQAAYEKSEFPFFFVTARNDEIASVQQKSAKNRPGAYKKTNEELLEAMADLTVKNITDMASNGEISLLSNRVIRSKKPVKALFDASDKLKYDNRYNVLKNQISPNGKIKPKRISVVKSMTVPEKNAPGENSSQQATFYRIAGGKIVPGEMYLEKKFDAGINLYFGRSFEGMSGIGGRFEYYFSKAMGGAAIPGKTLKGLSSVKIYFEAAQQKKSYSWFNQPEKFNFTRGSIGIEKEYHPLSFMHLGPFAGYGLEYTTWENSGDLLSSNFAEFGARLGINLRHNIQIVGSATYYHIIKTVWMDDNRDVVEPDLNYSKIFPDRPEFGYNIGLRIML